MHSWNHRSNLRKNHAKCMWRWFPQETVTPAGPSINSNEWHKWNCPKDSGNDMSRPLTSTHFLLECSCMFSGSKKCYKSHLTSNINVLTLQKRSSSRIIPEYLLSARSQLTNCGVKSFLTFAMYIVRTMKAVCPFCAAEKPLCCQQFFVDIKNQPPCVWLLSSSWSVSSSLRKNHHNIGVHGFATIMHKAGIVQ